MPWLLQQQPFISFSNPTGLQIRIGFDKVAVNGVRANAFIAYVPICSAPPYASSVGSTHRLGRELSESKGAGTGRVAVVELPGGVGERMCS